MTTLLSSYDRSGDLRRGAFYQIEVPYDTELSMKWVPDANQWIVSDATSCYDGQAWIEVCVDSEERHGCPLDREHVTGYAGHTVAWAELFGGDLVADFVRDCIGQSIVATEEFARRLVDSPLIGLALQEVPVRLNQSQLPETMQFRRLDFQGRDCVRKMWYSIPEPNECPRCHFGPIVCPICNETQYHCPECKLELVGFTNGPHDRPFTAEVMNATDWIVEADQWDGSDFFAERYITCRALRQLLAMQAKPFIVKPVWANVERMTAAQLAALGAL
jgi:hypothetical protein